MTPARAIRFEPSCDRAAEALGGYAAMDEALFFWLEPLAIAPEAFPRIETEWGSVRVLRTMPWRGGKGLLWYFVLDRNGDVSVVHVQEA